MVFRPSCDREPARLRLEQSGVPINEEMTLAATASADLAHLCRHDTAC